MFDANFRSTKQFELFRFDIQIKGSQVNGNYLSKDEDGETIHNVIAEDSLTWVCVDGRDEAGAPNVDPVGGFLVGCFPPGFTDTNSNRRSDYYDLQALAGDEGLPMYVDLMRHHYNPREGSTSNFGVGMAHKRIWVWDPIV